MSFRRLLAFALLPALLGTPAAAQQTIGLFQNDPGTFVGYTLFESMSYPQTYLIDNEGRLIHAWMPQSYVAAMSYLLDNGDLLRAAFYVTPYFDAPGAGGMVQRFDWDSNLLWEFVWADSTHRQHHDIEALPNGNVLLVAWERHTAAEAIAAGRNPMLISDGEIWSEQIVEIEPVGTNGGNVVWEWHVWDHLVQDYDSGKANYGVVTDHPELVDLNFAAGPGKDWLHANSIAYNPDLDQIAISLNQNREFWIIDHGTTSKEAAGHTGGARGRGGDLLYRWGNPQAYRRGTSADQRLYREHDVHWIASGLPGAGHILLFNNGFGRPGGDYSTADEIVTTADANGDYPIPAAGQPHGPAAALWSWSTPVPGDMFSGIISSASRLPNGNTLICAGSPVGTFREVAADTVAWLYVCPVGASGPQPQGSDPFGNRVFRTRKFPPEYGAFTGRDLTPGDPIELPPTAVVLGPAVPEPFSLRSVYPNPVRTVANVAFSLRDGAPVSLDVFDVAGRKVGTLLSGPVAAGDHTVTWPAAAAPAGVYFVRLSSGVSVQSRRIAVIR